MPGKIRTCQTKRPTISAPSSSADTQDMFPEICVSGATRGVRGKPILATGRGSDQFRLRLPDGMRHEIKSSAEANGRSTNSEIVHRLKEFSKGRGLHPPLDEDNADYGDGLEIVRLALHVHGREVAQALWHDFGLPMPAPPPLHQRLASDGEKQAVAFLDECTLPDPRWEITCHELFIRYTEWVRPLSGVPLDQSTFGRYLRKVGCKRRRSNGSIYVGIRLRDKGGA